MSNHRSHSHCTTRDGMAGPQSTWCDMLRWAQQTSRMVSWHPRWTQISSMKKHTPVWSLWAKQVIRTIVLRMGIEPLATSIITTHADPRGLSLLGHLVPWELSVMGGCTSCRWRVRTIFAHVEARVPSCKISFEKPEIGYCLSSSGISRHGMSVKYGCTWG